MYPQADPTENIKNSLLFSKLKTVIRIVTEKNINIRY